MSTPNPPYAQIAAALRDQIKSGELAPGDRVPSTRELTRQWGVAMATATKALTALRQEGLVRPVAGVGTVVHRVGVDDARERRAPAAIAVTRQPPSRTTFDGALTLTRIVTAAIEIADTEGLAALSMRRVAVDVGVATMSLYRHVADKDALVLTMMDTVMREWQPPSDTPEGWRAALELAARTLWAAFRRHQWLAPALSITRPQPIPGGMAYTEYVLGVLDRRGLDLPAMFNAHITLFNYIRGTALNLELEAQAESISGLSNDEWMDAQQGAMRTILDDGEFPLLTQMFDATIDFDLDVLFETGMRYLLDGLANTLVDCPGLPAGE